MLVRPDDEERDAAAYRQAVETEAANSTSQSWQDLLALDACRGSFSLALQVERLHYAAILLREQGRIEQILRDRDAAPAKRELIWVALYPHLLACGYTLPRSYAYGTPGVSVSYTLPLQRRGKDRPLDMVHYNVLPATTMKHGKQRRVALKIVCTRPGTDSAQELETLKYLNAEPVRSHPDNIAVQLLDVLNFPEVKGQPRARDLHIIVMPLLRPFSKTDSGAIGLVVELMRRMFRGLAFLHELDIAHGDIGWRNFMLSSSGPLPAPCLIDFQLSRRFDYDTQSGEGLAQRTVTWTGGQIPPPEVRDNPERPYDPFSADIYALAYIWAGGFGPPAGVFPPDAEHLLRRMLSPAPDERPASAGDCVIALERALPLMSFCTRCRPYPLLRSALRFAARNGQYRLCVDYGWKYVRGLAYILRHPRARALQSFTMDDS